MPKYAQNMAKYGYLGHLWDTLWDTPGSGGTVYGGAGGQRGAQK